MMSVINKVSNTCLNIDKTGSVSLKDFQICLARSRIAMLDNIKHIPSVLESAWTKIK